MMTICPKCRKEITRERGNLSAASLRRALAVLLERHQRDPTKCRPIPAFEVVVSGPSGPLAMLSWRVVGTDLQGGVGGGNPRILKRRARADGERALVSYLNRLMNAPQQDEHGQGD